VTKGRRAADRRREREQGKIDGGIDVDPSEITQFGPGDQTSYALPERADSLTKAADQALDDDKSELAGEPTVVREDRPKPKPPGIKLKLLSSGVIHDVTTTPFLIGRGTGNDLALEEMSVSRRHAQLVRLDDGGFLLEDLGAQSGTLVNGEVLAGAVIVTHGDIVQFGEVELRVRFSETVPELKVVETKEPTAVGKAPTKEKTRVTTVAPAPSAPVAKKSRAPVIAAIVALALVAVGVGVGVGVGAMGGPDPKLVQAEVEALVVEAEKLLKAGRFADARARIEAIFALAPGHAGAESLSRMIASEEEAKAALDDAKKACDAGDGGACLDATDRIADSSMYAGERDKLRTRATSLQRKRFFDEIDALIANGQYDAALERIDALLERWPDEPRLKELQKKTLRARGKKPPIPEGIRRARAAFAVGNREQARIIASADAERGLSSAADYVKDLDAFEQAFANGQRALAAKKGASATDALERAWALSRSLSGGESGVTRRDVGAALADALFLTGVADETSGRACAAAEKLLRAYALDPEDMKIAEKKRALDKRAADGLLRARARAANKPDDARAIAKEHLCFAARGSETASDLAELAR